MKELEKKLKELQKKGFEQIDIVQVLNWMYEIKRENSHKRAKRVHPDLDKYYDIEQST